MPDLDELSRTVEYMRGKLDTIAAALLGDPTDQEKPGILIRLDRLERSYGSHRKALGWLGGGLITVLGTVAATILIRLV